MTATNSSSSNKNKDLLQRLILLEKFIELKSNECAYYRTKVHLMQITRKSSSRNNERSSSEEISQSSIAIPSRSNSSDHRHRRNSAQKSSQEKAILEERISNSSVPFDPSIKTKRRHRKETQNKTSAQNQNYYEESSFPKDKNLLEQMLMSYLNKHLLQSVARDKNIQCNEKDFHSIESPHTILKIRLPHPLIKSLLAQQKRSSASSSPKLKVHLSSELLNKLFQSIHSNSKTPNKKQFTIQSQFGKIAACINHELALHGTSTSSHFVHL